MLIELSTWVLRMISRILAVSVLLLLGACGSDEPVLIETEVSLDEKIIASSYVVSIHFLEGASAQDRATSELKERIKPFESWVKSNGFAMHAGQHELRPRYQYSPSDQRQLVGYEARQQFQLQGLNFKQYQQVLLEGSEFKPQELSLLSVAASDEDKQQAKADLIEKAFSQVRHKAQAMSQVAGLCQPVVSEMREQFNVMGRPMMMAMERAKASAPHVHDTQSKQSLQLHLWVKWLAQRNCN